MLAIESAKSCSSHLARRVQTAHGVLVIIYVIVLHTHPIHIDEKSVHIFLQTVMKPNLVAEAGKRLVDMLLETLRRRVKTIYSTSSGFSIGVSDSLRYIKRLSTANLLTDRPKVGQEPALLVLD